MDPTTKADDLAGLTRRQAFELFWARARAITAAIAELWRLRAAIGAKWGRPPPMPQFPLRGRRKGD